jgi:hypothetical protein
MIMTTRYVILLLLVSFLLPACNPVKNMQGRERLTQLKAVVNNYRKMMRWGHFNEAAQYLKSSDGSEIQSDLENMSRYKVTNYTVADQITSESQFEAKVTAYVDFYDIDTGVASSVRDEQFWWFDEEEKHWFLGSPMINFSDHVK